MKSEEKSSNPQAYQVNLWIDKSLHKRVSLKNFRAREPQIINDLLYFEVGGDTLKKCVNKRDGDVPSRFSTKTVGLGEPKRKETPPWRSTTRKGMRSQWHIGSS